MAEKAASEAAIPEEFVDYRRRLIASTEADAFEARFLALFGELQKYRVDKKVMKLSLGKVSIQAFYLPDERYDVCEIISDLQPRFPGITLQRDIPMIPLQQAASDPIDRPQWALKAIAAEAAWARVAEATPRPAVTVAVIDSGIQVNHQGLDPLRISGLRVIPPAGNNFADDMGHGTMVAGTIIGNSTDAPGVAGKVSTVRVFAAKFDDARTPPTALAALAAISEAVLIGAKIINASWHVLEDTGLLAHAILYAGSQGCLVVTAAGNFGSDNDCIPTLPASYDFDNMIVVMASDRHDEKAWFSNYGAKVDLAAPGVQILSTGLYYVTPAYREYSGTSAAAAHVSGAAALLLAIDDWTPQEIREHLVASAEPVRMLRGICRAGGRLNLRRAVLGPFSVVKPEVGEQLQQGATYTVEWQLDYVAPVVQTIEIAFIDKASGAILSRCGGLSNDGNGQVVVPNIPTQQAIVRIRCEQKNLYADSAVFSIA